MKKWAFTLAEVLISLAVIGVISAMTLPALNSTLTTRQLETGTLRAYNMMQNAISRYMADNEIEGGLYYNSVFYDVNTVESFVEDNFKVVLKCSSYSDCFTAKYGQQGTTDNIDLAETAIANYSYPAYKLNNGTILQIGRTSIIIDVNGDKGPNILNKDLWMWDIRDDGMILDRRQGQTKTEIAENFTKCRQGENQYGCFANFLTNGYKFDY